MTKARVEISLRTKWEEFIGKVPYLYLSLGLWALGFAFYWIPKIGYLTSHLPWLEGLFRPVGEALVVAGVLVLLIDPFLKERLLREASRGVFHYLLGFDQEPEIQERLRKLVSDTKLFRRNYHLKCTLLPEGSDSMRLEMEVSFEVINPTNDAQTFSHEKVEKLTVRSMTLISEDRNYTETPALSQKSDDPEVLEAEAAKVQIKPRSKGVTYAFGTNFTMVYPREFFLAVNFSSPTIGVTIEVVPPNGFDVTANTTPTCTTNRWRYDKLFMPNEHLDVRWQTSTTQKSH